MRQFVMLLDDRVRETSRGRAMFSVSLRVNRSLSWELGNGHVQEFDDW